MKIKRLYSVDIFRIVCAFIIFVFHSHTPSVIYVDFGFFNNFVSNGHVFMTAFFMLSGFSLYYAWFENLCNKPTELTESFEGRFNSVVGFYIKRLAGIYPLYVFTALAYSILFNELTIMQNMALLPLEIALLQSFYPDSFLISHFGGTWFISCIFICYLIFPFVKTVIKNNSRCVNTVLLFLIWMFCSYQFVLMHFFDFANNFTLLYTHPMLRFCEFLSGMIVADLFEKNKCKTISKWSWLMIPFMAIAFILIVTVSLALKSLPMFFFTFIAFPVFGFSLYLCGRLETLHSIRICKRLVKVLSENTYAFYLAQFFTWKFVKKVNEGYLHLGNVSLFCFCFLWCSCVAGIMHYLVEMPCKKAVLYLAKRFQMI